MDPSIQSQNSIGGVSSRLSPHQVHQPQADFKQLLDRYAPKTDELKFSSHALQRLERRNIELSSSEKSRLTEGFDALKSKGVKDGLVVVGDHRFVVSVSNKTVITVMTSSEKEVFTDIQGVALV